MRFAQLFLVCSLASAGLTSCSWFSAAGPGSTRSAAEVDAELDDAVAAIVPPGEEEMIDLRRLGPDGTLAASQVSALAQEYPGHAGAQWAAAVLAWSRGSEQRAGLHAERVIALQPDHVGARVLRVDMAIMRGDLRGARREVDRGLELRPESAVLHETAARVAYLEDDLDGSAESLRMAERLGASQVRVAFNRGLIAEAAGDIVAARSEWQRCLDLDPDHGEAASRLQVLEARWSDR